LPVIEVPAGTRLYRTSDIGYPDPAYFGREPTYRFNAPDRSYGVCYFGTSLTGALLETLAISRPDAGPWFVTTSELSQRYVARATVLRPARLAYLADDGLQLLGIDLRVTGGNDYVLSRAWSAAIHRHAARVDGIFYPSRHHNRLFSVALFDRARDAIAFDVWGTLGDRSRRDLWLATTRFLRRFEIQLIVTGDH
jgi:hypothetical protein